MMTLSKLMQLYMNYLEFADTGQDDVCREIRREVQQSGVVENLKSVLNSKTYLGRDRLIMLFDLLKWIATPEAIGIFFEMVSHENKYIRTQAVQALNDCEIHDAVPTLCSMARTDKCEYVRKTAIMALRDLDADIDTIPTLLDVGVADDNSYVRYEAVIGLGQFSSRQISQTLATVLLQDENSYVRWAAASALKGTDDQELVAYVLIAGALEGNRYIRKAAMDALKSMPNVAMAALRQPLQDPDNPDRWMDFIILLSFTAQHTPEMVNWDLNYWN